jgi:hypothetical protein
LAIISAMVRRSSSVMPGSDGDVHGRHATCGAGAGASRFLIGLVTTRATHGAIPLDRASLLSAIDAGRYADELGEAGAERPERGAAHLEAHVGDAQVTATHERHRALDAPRHEVGVRRLAVSESEPAAEVRGRHVRVSGERLDVERLRVLPVDAIADAAKPRELAQALPRSGVGRHLRIVLRTGALGFALPRLAVFSDWFKAAGKRSLRAASLRISLKCELQLVEVLRQGVRRGASRIPPQQAPLEHRDHRRTLSDQMIKDLIEDSYDLVASQLPTSRSRALGSTSDVVGVVVD